MRSLLLALMLALPALAADAPYFIRTVPASALQQLGLPTSTTGADTIQVFILPTNPETNKLVVKVSGKRGTQDVAFVANWTFDRALWAGWVLVVIEGVDRVQDLELTGVKIQEVVEKVVAETNAVAPLVVMR